MTPIKVQPGNAARVRSRAPGEKFEIAGKVYETISYGVGQRKNTAFVRVVRALREAHPTTGSICHGCPMEDQWSAPDTCVCTTGMLLVPEDWVPILKLVTPT